MEPLLVEQLVTWIVALAIGAVLWAMGGRILRPSLGMAGLIIGSALGWLAWTQIQGHAPLWALMLGTGVITACVCMLAYKLVLAGILSILLSVFFMAGSWSLMQTLSPDDPPSAPLSALGSLVVGSPEIETDFERDVTHSADNKYAMAMRYAISTRSELLFESWKVLQPMTRLVVLGSLLAGLLIGLLMATFAIIPTAIFVTAVLGSLLILGSLARLISLTGASTHAIQESWVLLPTIIWAGLAVTGIVIQTMRLPRKGASDAEAN
ncbi:MAG: hypothetical protein MK095_08480 [Phycisphaerales bacterium]|nr:hypothetical protein [Phycisphaerales bacterium]